MDGVCAEYVYVCDHGLPEGHDSSSYLSRGPIETRRACERNRAHHVRASFFPSVRSTNLRTLRCVCSNADRVDASSRPRDDHRDGSRRSIAPRRDASVERVRDDARNRTDRTRGVCPVGARARDLETGRARTTRERVARGSREKICAARRRRARRDARTGGERRRGGASERE